MTQLFYLLFSLFLFKGKEGLSENETILVAFVHLYVQNEISEREVIREVLSLCVPPAQI